MRAANGRRARSSRRWTRSTLPDDFDAAQDAIAEAIGAANRKIVAEARVRGRQMGSTVVALLMRGARYAILWVGDSRAYVLRGGAAHPAQPRP